MKTKVVGLTGGIGSGKSTIAAYFKSLGVPVYIADDEAKKILYTSEAAAEVAEVFGNEVFTEGLPDRRKLASKVFNSPEKLRLLNNIIHPKVRQHFDNWLKVYTAEPFVIKEAAILFESGSYKDCDKIILVTAPEEVRIERVMLRDSVTREQVLKRMEAQWDDEKKEALSDYIIQNINLNEAKEDALRILKILNNI